MADEELPRPARLEREREHAYQRQLRFRDQVQRERTVMFFREPPNLGGNGRGSDLPAEEAARSTLSRVKPKS